MKTIRTIIGTLSAVLLTFALVAWFSVRRNAAFIQRTIYQGFDQTFVVALVMGCAFLLIAIILSVAIASTDDDDEDEEEEERFQPRRPTRPPIYADEEPYRRVSRSMEQSRYRREEDEGYARPRTSTADKPARRYAEEEPRPVRRRAEEAPAPKRWERDEEWPEDRDQRPVKRKPPRPERSEEPEEALELEEVLEQEEAPEAAEENIRCIFCGAQMPRGAEFCPACGKKR